MSFGGFIGGGSSGGGGGDAGLMMADNLYSTIPTSALAHTQPHMVSPPPMVQPIFNSLPLSLAVVCHFFLSNSYLCICMFACIINIMDEIIFALRIVSFLVNV